MLNETSFLNRLPAALDIATKLMLEVTVFDLTAIEIAYRRLERSVEGFSPEDYSSLNSEARLSMILDCWSIIDRSYSLFKAFKKLPPPLLGDLANDLTDNFEGPVSTMRNFMDHTASRVPQLDAKTNYNPLLGHVIFYVGVLTDHFGPKIYIGKHAVTVQTGSHHQPSMTSMPVHLNEPMEKAIGNFWFGAAETEVFVTGLVTSLREFASAFDENARAVVEDRARREAESRGESLDDLLRPNPRYSISIASWS